MRQTDPQPIAYVRAQRDEPNIRSKGAERLCKSYVVSVQTYERKNNIKIEMIFIQNPVIS